MRLIQNDNRVFLSGTENHQSSLLTEFSRQAGDCFSGNRFGSVTISLRTITQDKPAQRKGQRSAKADCKRLAKIGQELIGYLSLRC